MLYHYHVTRDKDEPFKTVDTMQTVEADDPFAAVAKLASAGLLPDDGTFYVRIVTVVHDNGMPSKAVCVPLTVEAKIPLDWSPSGGAPE